MNMQRKLGLTAVLAAALALGGCFGDDDDNNTPAPAVPPSPTAGAAPILLTSPTPADLGTGSEGLVAYVQKLIAAAAADPTRADLTEPLDISGVTLQTNDTDEPTAPI